MNNDTPADAMADYTWADWQLAEECVSAANVVTCDGYYEVDIEKVAETLARHRTTSLAAHDGLVEALAVHLYEESMSKTLGAAKLVSWSDDTKQFWVERAKVALSAIKGDKS